MEILIVGFWVFLILVYFWFLLKIVEVLGLVVFILMNILGVNLVRFCKFVGEMVLMVCLFRIVIVIGIL